MNYRIITYLICLLLVTSCHEDIFDDKISSESTAQVTIADVYNEVESDIIGFVGDDTGNPIEGAFVETYSTTAITDEYGIFSLIDAYTDQLGTYMTISKDGFLSNTQLVYPTESGSIIAKSVLQKASESVDFENTDGGTVVLQNGGEIVFDPASITQGNGSSYDGVVSVVVSTASASDDDFGVGTLGGFRAKGTDGADKVIAAFATLDVNIEGDDQQVKVAEASQVSVGWPIPEELISQANNEVPVWLFDTEIQKWIGAGKATKNGDAYEFEIGKAGHFMLGDPYALVRYCIPVTNGLGLSLSNIHYRIHLGEYAVGGGVTGDDGVLCSFVPLEEEFEIEFYHASCLDILRSVTIDPQSEASLGEPVIIETQAQLRTGTVTCDQVGLSNAIVMVLGDDLPQLFLTNQTGDFSFDLDLITCDQTDDYQVVAIGQGESSPTINQSSANTVAMNLEVCDLDCDVQATIEFFKGDYCVSGPYEGMRAIIEGGSGEFDVLWSDGNTTLTTEVPPLGTEICMTLKDQSTGCEVQECMTSVLHEAISVSELVLGNPACQTNTGEIDILMSGGVGPFLYSWTGPDGFVSVEERLEMLQAGLYSLTVTDSKLCTATREVELFDVTAPLQSDIVDGCNSKMITVIEGEGNKPYTYQWSNNASTTESLEVTSPGVYAVTVTDAINCNRSITFEINTIASGIAIDQDPDCDLLDHAFQNLAPDASYEVITSNAEPFEVLDEAGILNVSVLDSGYDFDIIGRDSTGCESTEGIQLPHFEGLVVEDVVVGEIIYVVDEAAACRDCAVGMVSVWRADTYQDVTSDNQLGELSSGEYLIVVLSEDESCVIGHQRVSVE